MTEFGMCGETIAPEENDGTTPPSVAMESAKRIPNNGFMAWEYRALITI